MATTFLKFGRHSFASTLAIILIAVTFTQCKKNDFPPHGNPGAHSSEVLDKWMTLQLRLMKNTTGVPNHAFGRHFAYSGITSLEALAPGLPQISYWRTKWNGLTGLPSVNHSGANYYYPANVNAAMAAINRSFFPNASATDKSAIDSLENALNQKFLEKESQERITKSADFGKAVAAAVFSWAETDKYKDANAPYTVPTGVGLWKPTPPAFAAPATPYFGNNRTIIKGSTTGTLAPVPPAYSTEESSPFFQGVKKVYDASATLTDDQKAMAIFWRDVPGVSSPGHWENVLLQLIHKTNPKLDKAALAYALTGAGINDALIICFKSKYQYNVVRPITYIKEVMGHTEWNSHLGTPGHPEYPSAHSSLSAAAAVIIEKLFGQVGQFTDHTYDYMGFAPRTYNSIAAIAEEAGTSRLYAGIHYQYSIDEGLLQGKKVAANILNQ